MYSLHEKYGFYLESLAVCAEDKETAKVSFKDGFNVLYGPSETGKSLILEYLDYAFGRTSEVRFVTEAAAYAFLICRLRVRKNHNILEIRRTFGQDEVVIQIFEQENDKKIDERRVKISHSSKDANNLSSILLQLCGLDKRKLRKTQSEAISLTFRILSRLIIVNDKQIRTDEAPYSEGQFIEATQDQDLFQQLVSGSDLASQEILKSKKSKAETKNRKAFLLEAIDDLKKRLETLGVPIQSISDEFQKVNSESQSILEGSSSIQSAIDDNQRRRGELRVRCSFLDQKTAINLGLLNNFSLLKQHYESDIERLKSISEIDDALRIIDSSVCPFCGKTTQDKGLVADKTETHDNHATFQAAVSAEIKKTEQLLRDLIASMKRIERETRRFQNESSEKQNDVLRNKQEATVLHQALAKWNIRLGALQGRRDVVIKAIALREEIERYTKIVNELAEKPKDKQQHGIENIEKSIAEAIERYCEVYAEVLLAWNFPFSGKVFFSDREKDFLLGTKKRGAMGQGARAITCASFFVSLMRHCMLKHYPHPSMLALDSPLLAYTEPESDEDGISSTGVKEAFYSTLDRECMGQVIVVENQSPPNLQNTNVIVFTKTQEGRYGFFPRADNIQK